MKLITEQIEIMEGNLLGDGSLDRPQKSTHNSFFTVSQKLANKEYVLWLYNVFQPFSTYDEGISRRNGREHPRCRIRTKKNPIFTDYRSLWYDGKNKIIPKNLRLSWKKAAIWACDDGCNPGGKSKYNKFRMHTESFQRNDVEFLVEKLKDDLGITTSIQYHGNAGQLIIDMYGQQAIDFVNGIKPFIHWNCFSHKLIIRPFARTHIYPGVSFEKRINKWRARAVVAGRHVLNRTFHTLEEAIAYRKDWENGRTTNRPI